MRTLLFLTTFLILKASWSQIIYHPISSKSIVKVKSGQVYRYCDSGGPNENYSYNTNSMITIYPDKKGEFVSINCDSVQLASDTRMYIFDGNHPGSAILGYFNGKVGLKGKTFTASSANASGAISIRFVSLKRRTTQRGWDFTVTTVRTPGAVPRVTSQDCSGAIKVCSDSAITTRASGAGIQELPGPGFWSPELNYDDGGENQSNWYKFEVKTAGTIEFLISPRTQTDFDWALWGPYKAHECPAWTTDSYYRVSACAGSYHNGLTGLSKKVTRTLGRGDSDECFVAAIDVKPGEHYVIMIDDWSGNHTTFRLSWTFSNGASLECKKDKEPPANPDHNDVEIDIAIDTAANTVEPIDTTEIKTDPCLSNAPLVTGEIIDEPNLLTKGIDVKVEGGTTPYQFKWTNSAGKILTSTEDISGVPEGVYELEVTDKNNCIANTTFTLTIEVTMDTMDIEPIIEAPRLEANLSEDEQFVTVKYPGPFEWEIENMNSEIVRTGHATDAQEVDISKLPPGQYRVSLIYKQIKQYTTFYKK